jgi:GST-like protein
LCGPIDILADEQFGSGFVALNLNSKNPAPLERSTHPLTRVFERCAISLYLAEKYVAFLPFEPGARAVVFRWLS